MSKKNFIEICAGAAYCTVAHSRNELNLFCEIMGYPKSRVNYFIGDDPHGIVDIMEGYRSLNMTDIHTVISEYEHWLELYGSNDELRKQVDAWYYYCIDWHNQNSQEEPRWVSVEERLPEMTEETKGYQDSPEVLVCYGNGKIGTMYYSYAYGRWEIGGGGMPAPLYWKPIITPEQEAERSKGCPNLRSWLAGCPVDGLREATPEWKEEQRKSLEEAHRRTEEAKQALYQAMEEEVKLNKF